MTTTEPESHRLWIPGELWTLNAERGQVTFKHRRRTEALRKAAKETAEAENFPALRDPVMIQCWPRTFSGRGDVGGHMPALKAAVDGLVDAGVLVEDTPKWVRCIAMYPPARAKPSGLILVIRPIETD